MLPSPDSIKIITLVIPLALFAYGFFKRPLYAVLGYFCLVYFKTSAYFPAVAAIKGELIFAGVTFVIILLHKAPLEKLSPQYNPVNKYLYLFTACVGFSYIVAIDQEWSWFYAVYHYIKVLILYVMVILTVNEERDLKIFTWGIVMVYVYMTYEPLYGYLYGVGGSQHMYGTVYTTDTGILSGHVALANNMNQMIPIVLFLMISQKKKIGKIVAFLAMLAFLLSLIASQSRGGFVGFIALAGLTVLYLRANKKLLAVAIPGIIAVFLLSATLVYTGSRIKSGAIEGRLLGLAHGIEMIRIKYHIFGVGPGCFQKARSQYFGYTMDAHNLYGEVVGELGIPGSIIWALLIWNIYKNLKYARERENVAKEGVTDRCLFYLSTGYMVSFMVRLFLGMGSHGLYFFYWYIIGAISIMCVKISDEKAVGKKIEEQSSMWSYPKRRRGIRNYGGYKKNT